jgi:hypothetical protein
VEVRRPETPLWEATACVLAFGAAVLVLRVWMPGHAARWIAVSFLAVLVVAGWRGQVRHNAARRAALAELGERGLAMSPEERAAAWDKVREELGGALLPSMRRARRELAAMPGGLAEPRAGEARPRLPLAVELLVLVPAIAAAVEAPVMALVGAESRPFYISLSFVFWFVVITVNRRTELRRTTQSGREVWIAASMFATLIAIVMVGSIAFGIS